MKKEIDEEYETLLHKEHNEDLHRFQGKGVMEAIFKVLDSRRGLKTHVRRIIILSKGGWHKDCTLCYSSVRRSWRRAAKLNRSLLYDKRLKFKGSDRSVAKYERLSANIYRSVAR